MADWRDRIGADPETVASPGGLQQQQAAVTGTSQEQQSPAWMERISDAPMKADRNPAWQTGGGQGSTENSWFTPFYEKMFTQQQSHLEKGTLGAWYSDKDFTGVATWNGQKDATGRSVAFGDVYEDGQYRGNLLDPQGQYTEEQAYTMLAQLTLDADEQAAAFNGLQSSPTAVKDAVIGRLAETDKEIAAYTSQQEYRGAVQAQKDDWDDDAEGWLTFGAGALGGAGLGMVAGPWGAAAGAIVGGFSALANKDSLVEQAASAAVQTQMAGEQFGQGGAIATGLRQWGGAAMGAISPLSNTVQGITDMTVGTIGDDRTEYYEMEERPWWLTGLGLTATLGDSLLQFATPGGQAMFFSSMGASVAGGVGQLALQEGATFDDRRGDFHKPEDLGQWMAAIGAVGIDAVQMVGNRGIAKAVQNSDRAALGLGDDVVRTGLFNRNVPEGAVRSETIGSRRYFLDEAGQVVGTPRTSFTVLAPSEATMWASARLQMQIVRAGKQGAMTPQQVNQALYQAAKDIEDGTNLAKTALLNAFGEGAEEAAQSILEPLSHGWAPDGNEVIMSWLQGAAAGAGMSVGAQVGGFSRDYRAFSRANQIAGINNMPKLTREEWAAMTPEAKRQAVAAPPLVDAARRESAQRAATESVMEAVRSDVALARSMDALVTVRDQELRTMNPSLEGTYTIGALQDPSIPNHVLLTDLDTVIEMLQANADSLADQVRAAAEKGELIDPAVQEVAEAGRQLMEMLLPLQAEFEVSQDPALTSRINDLIEQAWGNVGRNEQGEVVAGPLAKAVSVLISRSPNNSAGSFQMLMPQVSLQDTLDGGRGLLKISHALLKMIDGDFDGDMARQHVQVAFETNDDAYRKVRLGLNALGMAGGGVKIGTRATEEFAVNQLGLSIKAGESEKQAAEGALIQIEGWLTANLATLPTAQDLIRSFIADLRAGRLGAKDSFFTALNVTSSDAMTAIGENGTADIPAFSSPYMAIDQKVNEILTRFTETVAARSTAERNLRPVKPIEADSPIATRAAMSAATLGATMHQLTPGNDAFRAAQHLHYSDYRSPVEAAGIGKDTEFDRFVELYEEMSSGITQSELDRLFSKDEVVARANVMLERIVRAYELKGVGRAPASLLAGLAVPNYTRSGSEFQDQGGYISLGQFVLRESVRQAASQHPDLYEDKVGLYSAMGPGEAYVELFESTPLLALIGEAANNFGAQMTLGQFKASILRANTFDRRDMRERARSDVRYQGGRHDLPYSFDEATAEGNSINDYHVFVDAVFEAADLELSANPKTGEINPNSRLYQRDQRVQAQLENAFSYTRKALQDLAKVNRVGLFKKGTDLTDVGAVMRLLDQNPGLGQAVANLLPTDIVNVVFAPQADGTTLVRRWFAEMLTQEPKQALMTYFRHTFISKMNALGAETNPRAVEDRMIELALQLQQGDPVRYGQFQELLFESTDLDSFMAEINKRFQTGAPQLAWYRDVAQFDPSRGQGGWSKALPGTELRDAIRKFHTQAVAFQDYASQELELDANDAGLVSQLSAALEQIRQGRKSDDEYLLAALQERFKTAATLRPALGPSTLLRSAYGAITGFMGGMTDKGKGATYYETLANIQALGSSPLQSIGYLQLMGSTTAWDADDAAANPSLFAGQDLRVGDRAGRVSEWAGLSDTSGTGQDAYQDVARFLEMWKQPEFRPLLRAAVFPTAFEEVEGGGMSQQLLTKMGLRDLLGDPHEGDIYSRMLGSESRSDVLRYAAQVDAQSAKYGRSFGLQRMAAALGIARTSAASRTLDVDTQQSMAADAMIDVARLVRRIAAYDNPAEARKMVQDSLNRLHRSFVKDTFTDPESQALVENAVLASLAAELPANPTKEQVQAAEQYDKIIERLVKGNDGVLQEYMQAYLIDWRDEATATQRQHDLWEIVRSQPSIAEQTLVEEIRQLRTTTQTDVTGNIPLLAADPKENKARWDAVARGVLSAKLTQHVTGFASTRVAASVLPKTTTFESVFDAVTGELRRDQLGHARYMDPSYRYLLDDIVDDNSAILAAAREFRGLVKGPSVLREDVQDAIDAVLDPKHLGPWNPFIMRQSVDAENRIDSSGASRQVASAGILYAKYAAPIAATQRSYRDPEAAGIPPRAYQIDAETSARLLDGSYDALKTDALQGAEGQSEPLAMLNGRFLKGLAASYRDADGNVIEVNLLTDAPVSPTHRFEGTAAGRLAPIGATSLAEISASLGSIVPVDATDLTIQVSFFHPQDQPAGPEWANNLYFEGTVLEGAGDNNESLIGSLVMGIDGLNVTEQVAALKANKKGTDALINPSLPSLAEIKAMEASGLADLYTLLQAKTMYILGQSMGHANLDPGYYNALFKDLKMRHGLRVVAEDGAVTLLSADEAIALQRDGQMPQGNLELVVLTPRMLNSLLGEQDTHGLLRPMLDTPTIDSAGVSRWNGSLVEYADRVPGLMEREGDGPARARLLETRVGARTAMSQSSVTPPLSTTELQVAKRRMEVWASFRNEPDAAREKNLDKYRGRIDAAMNTLFADQSQVLSQIPQYALREAGVALDLPIDANPMSQTMASNVAFGELWATLMAENTSTTWDFSYNRDIPGTRATGVLHGMQSLEDLKESSHAAQGDQVLHRDLVLVHLDTFPQAIEERKTELYRVVKRLAERGASIAIIDKNGDIDNRLLTPGDLESMSYRPVPGARGLYVPMDPSSRYRTVEAMYSRLAEVEEVYSDSVMAVFHSSVLSVNENAALINKASTKNGREVAITSSLAPTTAYHTFGIAATETQRFAVRDQLNALATNEAAIDHLLKLSRSVDGGKKLSSKERRAAAKDRDELVAALKRAAGNYDVATGLPSIDSDFGPGDIIALVGAKGNLILTRHGYSPIRDLTDLQVQLATPAAEGGEPGRIAIFGTRPLESATTYSGKIREWQQTSGYGLSLRQAVPLSEIGNKGVSELNGAKLVSSSDVAASPHELPSFGFMRGWDIDILTHWDDSTSKENYSGLIANARDAFAYLGVDFVPAYAQSLFGISRSQWESMNDADQLSVRTKVRDLFSEIVRTTERVNVLTVKGMMDSIFDPSVQLTAALTSLSSLDAFGVAGANTSVLTSKATKTPEDLITLAALTYLQYQGADAGHVLGTPGFGGPKVPGRPQSMKMPELFTAVFDNAAIGSDLRKHIFAELNSRLDNTPALATGSNAGYHLGEDWTFTILNDDPTKNLEGRLQFAEFHSSGHNSIIKEQSRQRNQTESVSRQQTLVIEESLGASMYRAKDLVRTRRFVEREGIVDPETGGDVISILQNPNLLKVPTYGLTRQLLPAERLALEVNRDARIEFQQPANTSEWSEADIAAWDSDRRDIVLDMGLTEAHSHFVDTWVRAWLARPANLDDPTSGVFSYADAKDAIAAIRSMLAEGRYPIDGASMTQMGLTEVLALAAAANKPGASWKLRDPQGNVAKSLEDFVLVALNPDRAIGDYAFQNAADGFMNTFRNLGDEYSDLPVSANALRMSQLFDSKTHQMVISMDPTRVTRMQAGDIGAAGTVLSDIFGGRISGGRWTGKYPESNGVAAAQKRMAAWRKKNNIPIPVPMTLEQMRQGGMRFVTTGTQTNALMRIMTNMRAANGMFNPWLFATAPVESWIKNTLEASKNLLLGEGTGAFSQWLADKTGGATTQYGSQLMAQKEAVARSLGDNQAFKSMVNNEILVHPKLSNAGPVEAWTAKMAGIAGRWQDPSWGMKQETLARRYLDSIMRSSLNMGSRMTLTPAQLLAEMQSDPEFIQKNHPELHRYAINTVANIRSLKPTVASLLLMKSFVDPLSNNPRVSVNVPSTIMLKLPLLFFNFAANQMTNMLGLHGLNAVSAMAMNTPKLKRAIGKSRAFLMGEGKDYSPDRHDVDFVSETMESVNLADAFIQSGLTHTGLMGLGMLAGSLGLSGEDEEDKRRRRAASVQGAGHVYDPREIVNDWRNADAMYLDNLPDWFPFADALREMYKVGVDQDGDAVSMVQLHWTMKQFISPAMGIESFLNTGNFAHVLWGFEDALGAMPLVNESSFDQWTRVAVELQNSALEADGSGNPDELPNSFGLLMNGVMGLERMLLENSFVNGLYTAMDQYDRDPYTLVQLDENGNIVRDKTGNAQDTPALQDFINGEGEAAQGYLRPDWTETKLKQLTENRASLALMMSLTDGFGDSEFWRQNMAIKTRKIDQEALTEDEATSIILNMWDPKSQREVLTDMGGVAVIRGLQMGTVKPGDPALDNVHLTYEQRQAIQEILLVELKQDFLDAGLTNDQADYQVKQTWYGSDTNPYAIPLQDVVWSVGKYQDAISYNPTIEYRQLNTTYITGPDGKPWATGIARSSLENFWGMAPLQTYNTGQLGGNLGQDERLNSTDSLANLNTGKRNLERVNKSVKNPTLEDLQKTIDEGFNRVIDAVNQPSWARGNGYNGRGYSRRGYGGGGGGSGYEWTYRVNSPERNDAVYGRNIPFTNVDNPIIRRASIRRERFSSTRGRLNQWQ